MFVKGIIVAINLLICLTASTVHAQTFECPFVDDMKMCKCYPRAQAIKCGQEATEQPDLTLIIGHLQTLDLTQSRIKVLDLTRVQIKNLILQDNIDLTEIVTTNPIERIEIHGNNFDLAIFKSNINVNTLKISVKELKVLDLSKFTSVIYLTLKNSEITKIPAEFFKNLEHLKELDLSNNRISTLEANGLLLSPSAKATSIDLSNSGLDLASLRSSGITEITEGITLELSHNKITTLDKEFIEKLSKVFKEVYLDGNSIECEPGKLDWIFNRKMMLFVKKAQCDNFGNNDIFSLESKLRPQPTTLTPSTTNSPSTTTDITTGSQATNTEGTTHTITEVSHATMETTNNTAKTINTGETAHDTTGTTHTAETTNTTETTHTVETVHDSTVTTHTAETTNDTTVTIHSVETTNTTETAHNTETLHDTAKTDHTK